jgi:bis(5'-nucleosidyl)-tetraphosphatase
MSSSSNSNSEKKTNKRAGVVIIKNTSAGPKLLGLRFYGSFDLPKGGVEPFENIFAAAIREAEEESGITDLDFKWGMVTIQVRNVTLFIAKTEQEPVIRRNPETGVYEHHGAQWLTLDQASKKLHPYLRSIVSWVREVIGDDYVDIS